MNTLRSLLPSGLLALLLVLCIGLGTAQQSAAREKDFSAWLESFGAWDILESELARKSPTPETVLRRAELLMKQRKLKEAVSLLDEYGSFSQAEAEGQRLWLKARAYRLREDHIQALLWYSQAGMQLGKDNRRERFEKEPGFPLYLESIWKRWFWQRFTGRSLQANAGQRRIMARAAELAESVWPKASFWTAAQGVLNRLDRDAEPSRESRESNIRISRTDRNRIASALAAIAVNHFSAAANALQRVDSAELRDLWSQALRALFPEDFSQELQARALGLEDTYPKYKACQGMVLPRLAQMRSHSWKVDQPKSNNWAAFSEGLLGLEPSQALQRIDKELQSALLSRDLQLALRRFRLAYAFLAGKSSEYQALWQESSSEDLPLSLKLCGAIHGLSSLADLFGSSEVPLEDRRILSALLQSLQSEQNPHILAPFWIRSQALQNKDTGFSRPLDPLLAYHRAESAWADKQDASLAKRIALLFPQTELANKALMLLAEQAHEKEHLQLASEYLRDIEPQGMDQDFKARFLTARAGLAMEEGNTRQSLRMYQELLDKAPQALSAQKRLKIALVAQRLDEWDWAQRMLDGLWANRRELKPSLQAEILFWLAEGDQKKGRLGRARKRYLQLAWGYPEQNIWSVTAQYRAALMYEQQGRLSTAGALLERVVERADRKGQKEAAKERLQGIEKRMQGKRPSPEPQFAY